MHCLYIILHAGIFGLIIFLKPGLSPDFGLWAWPSTSLLRIGSSVYCRGSRHKDQTHTILVDDIPTFPNLCHFECLGYCCHQGLLQKLSSKTRLSSLAISINCSILLNLMDFPNIQTLCLSMLCLYTHCCYMGLSFLSLWKLMGYGR